MTRLIEATATEYNGITFRSKTEAKWAVFLDALGIEFEYEKHTIPLSISKQYLPDFFLPQLNAFLEVKPDNEEIVIEECIKARCLAKDDKTKKVWLAIGLPKEGVGNILPLSQWNDSTSIQDILGETRNRYYFCEDRRDEGIFWLQSDDFVGKMFAHSYCVGGWGTSTDHMKPPIISDRIKKAVLACDAGLDAAT